MPSPSWRECMVSAGLPQKMADAIIALGYDSQDVFRSAFVDKNAFETWLCKSRDKLGDEASGVDAGDWTTCPLAAKLRLFLSGLQPPTPVGAPAVTPSKESSLALLPFASSQSKVSANEREAWRRQIEKDYPSAVITPETLPSLGFLQLVRQQCAGSQWEWIAWKRVLSEEQVLEVRGRKNSSGYGEFLDLFAVAAGIQHEEWDMDLVVLPPCAFKIFLTLGRMPTSCAVLATFTPGLCTRSVSYTSTRRSQGSTSAPRLSKRQKLQTVRS